MNFNNIIFFSDSYKFSHWTFMPPEIEFQNEYIESRGGKYPELCFNGIQPLIKKYLMTPITQSDIDEADAYITAHGEPFDRQMWQYILDVFGGWIPLIIEAVPEGTILPYKNVMVQVRNVGGELTASLAGHFEDLLLRGIWYPTTVATKSRNIKSIIKRFFELSSTETDVDYQFVDFGYRGASSHETASIGGAANLINFRTTDNVAGMLHVSQYYNHPGPCAISVPASQHSAVLAWGKDRELDFYRNAIKIHLKKGKFLSLVIDTYCPFDAIRMIAEDPEINEIIRTSGGTLVLRPDSGNALTVLLQCFYLLRSYFGSSVNDKGYEVLNYNIKLLQGDGVSEETIESILDVWVNNYFFSAEVIIWGAGGELLQKVDRDTSKYAQKGSAFKYKGQDWFGNSKDPSTDPGKRSKEGLLALIPNVNYRTLQTMRYDNVDESLQEMVLDNNILRVVYDCGELLVDDDFDVIRKRAEL